MRLKSISVMFSSMLTLSLPLVGYAQDKSISEDVDGFCVVDIAPESEKTYVRQENLTVPDLQPQHHLRIAETEQTMTNTTLCNGDKLVSKKAYFMFDNRVLDGIGMGYNIYITDKGDHIIIKTNSNAKQKQEDEFSTKQTIGVIVGGTGAYAGASGDYQSISHDNRFKNLVKTVEQRLRIKMPEKVEKSVLNQQESFTG